MNTDKASLKKWMDFRWDPRLSGAKYGPFQSLNDIPEALIAEARLLGDPHSVRKLLTYYTPFAWRPDLPHFIDEVVFGSVPVKLWHIGDTLVLFSTSMENMVCKSREELLAPLGGTTKSRIAPRLDDWQTSPFWVGCPALARPESNHLRSVPSGTTTFLGTSRVEPIGDLTVAMRRWIAVRLAYGLKDRIPTSLADFPVRTPPLPPVEEWSEDARAALAGLLREFREFGSAEGAIPGFRGPDEWFRDA